MVENKVCENTLAKAETAAAVAEQFESGDRVTYGNSKLEWVVDEVRYGVVYLNRQHGKQGNGHYLSFKQVRLEEALTKLHKVVYEDEEKHFTLSFTEGEMAAVYTALITAKYTTANATAALDKLRDTWRKQ